MTSMGKRSLGYPEIPNYPLCSIEHGHKLLPCSLSLPE